MSPARIEERDEFFAENNYPPDFAEVENPAFDRRVSAVAKAAFLFSFLVIVAGALITGRKAALSDATWPLFSGEYYPKYWKGGLIFEDSHRILVGILSFFTIALAVVAAKFERRPAVRKFCYFAVGLIVVQALLGGVIIRYVRPITASILHATAGELFLATTAALATITSRRWFELSRAGNTHDAMSFSLLSKVAVAMVYVQIILGAGIRHLDRHSDTAFYIALAAHFANYIGVVFMMGALQMRMRGLPLENDASRPLRAATNWAVLIVFLQAVFGVIGYFANRDRQEDKLPLTTYVLTSTVHLALGAALLATLVLLAFRAHRITSGSSATVFAGEAHP